MTRKEAIKLHHKRAKEYARKHNVKYWYARCVTGTLKGKVKPER